MEPYPVHTPLHKTGVKDLRNGNEISQQTMNHNLQMAAILCALRKNL
jgi:hypothetical protein